MRIKLAILLILAFLLAACGGKATPTEETAAVPSTPEPTTAPKATVGPSPTPLDPLVILVIPADMIEERSREYQTTVYELAQSAGYRFQVLNKLTVPELDPTLKVVVAVAPDMELAALAAAAPQAQFLAINIPGVTPGGNVSVLGGSGTRIDQQAFIAGYIGAMVTEDYHTGVILRKGTPEADIIRRAFRAGQEFFCGLCNPYAGPFEEYPLDIEIPEDAKPAEYSAYADFLIRKKVDTLFLQPGIDIPELEEYLSNIGALVMGTQHPSKELGGWMVTLQPNYLEALKAAWPDLVAGNGGRDFPAPLAFNDVNEEFFTVGKQNDALRILNDLLSGLISTGVQ